MVLVRRQASIEISLPSKRLPANLSPVTFVSSRAIASQHRRSLPATWRERFMSTTNVEAARTHSGAFVFTVSAVSALAGLLFGYDTGVISGARLFFQEDFRLATFQEEVVVSAVLL